MINIKEFNIERILKNNLVENMFHVDFTKEEWIWVNRDIFFDIIYNVLEYDSVDEEELAKEIETIGDNVFFNILEYKFKEIGWVSINQMLFEKLVDDFVSTKDIKTFIYINKKYYTRKIIDKTNELSWILKAMAIDAYQHLALEDKSLVQIYEEYFNENGMIIEEILVTGKYDFNVATWRLNKNSNILEFYKTKERYSQWSEGNSMFMFNELSK